MIEDNQKYFNRLLAVFDAVIVAFSYWLAWYIKFRSRLFSRGSFEAVPYPVYMSVMPIMVIMMIILYWAVGLYSPHRMRGRRVEIRNIIAANIMEYAAFIVVLYMRHQMYWSRSMLSMFAAINAILDIAMRLGVWQILTNMRKKGRFVRNVLLVGYSHAAEEFIDRVLTNPQWGYNIRGILDDRVEAGTEYKGIKVLGRIDNLMVILPENHLDEIDITLGLGEYYRLENIVALCEKSGVHTKFIPDYYNIIPTKPYTEDLLGLPVINIRYVPLSNTFNAMLKRILDIIGSLICIALFSPVLSARPLRGRFCSGRRESDCTIENS